MLIQALNRFLQPLLSLFLLISSLLSFPDLSRAHFVRHQTSQEDEVQDRVLPAGAANALSQDVQGRDPLLQRHDLRG